MFERIANSWELMRQSFRVLQADKELMIFPFLAAIASILVAISFFVPMALLGQFDQIANEEGISVVNAIAFFIFYVISYFVTIFSNSALVGAALIRLNGGDPTVRDGLRIASSHVSQIFGYAVIAATVGMILRAIAERTGTIGDIVVGLVGMAWSLATFMVVPVLVTENVGPIEAIKRSSSLLRRTWGEQITGNFSLGAIFGILFVVLAIISVVLFGAIASIGNSVLTISFVAIMALAFIVLALLNSTLSGIYAAAVYQYTTTGNTGDFFDANIVRNSFRQK
ncbi:MAG: DUF6159 family protein [Chloroflexota bacterium]